MRAGSQPVWLLRPQLWAGLWLAATVGLMALPEVTDLVVSKLWLWLSALTLASALLHRLHAAALPGDGNPAQWIGLAALPLPPAERRSWVAEATSVLDACQSGSERRRQLFSYLLALPHTTVLAWHLTIKNRGRR